MATANLNDMATLATDPTFGNRVQMALTKYCTITVLPEVISTTAVPYHLARKNYASQVINNPATVKAQWVIAVAANQIVASEATATATIVGQQGAALQTSALLCTDTDISNAVASAFDTFISNI